MLPRGNQETLSFPIDTATPHDPVPIFYLHAGEHLFCTTPGCLCTAYDKELEALLRQVIDGRLQLRHVRNGGIHGLTER